MIDYVLNFFVVYASIVLFVAPFFVWYWVGHRTSISTVGINRYLENFFSSKQANWLVFFWAAGEAVLWFVIPEFLLLLVIFMRIHKKRLMLVYDIAGTVAGTLFALFLRLNDAQIARLPYIQERMVEQTRIWYNDMGILGLINQPFSGVPYKVFTTLVWQYEFTIIIFLIVAISVRLARYILFYGFFMSMYPRLHRVVYHNYIPLATIAILIFSILLLKTYNLYS